MDREREKLRDQQRKGARRRKQALREIEDTPSGFDEKAADKRGPRIKHR